MNLIDPRFLNGQEKKRLRQIPNVLNTVFQWWWRCFNDEVLAAVSNEDFAESQNPYLSAQREAPKVWDVIREVRAKALRNVICNRRRQLRSPHPVPALPKDSNTPFGCHDNSDEESFSCSDDEEEALIPDELWDSDDDVCLINCFYWSLALEEVDDESINFDDEFVTVEQTGQHGFVLHRENAQYIHEISREEVRKLYLQHNGAAAEYLDSTYDGSGAESEDGAYEGDTEHEETKTNEDMEGMDGDIHDRFEKLEFDDASADSLTNKDSSDDQQDEGN